jgi:hypothetical protein
VLLFSTRNGMYLSYGCPPCCRLDHAQPACLVFAAVMRQGVQYLIQRSFNPSAVKLSGVVDESFMFHAYSRWVSRGSGRQSEVALRRTCYT